MNFIDKCRSILPDYLMEIVGQDSVRFFDYPYEGMTLVIRNEEHQYIITSSLSTVRFSHYPYEGMTLVIRDEEHQYIITSSRRNELSILEYYEQLVPKCDFINLDLLKYEVEKLKEVWK